MRLRKKLSISVITGVSRAGFFMTKNGLMSYIICTFAISLMHAENRSLSCAQLDKMCKLAYYEVPSCCTINKDNYEYLTRN